MLSLVVVDRLREVHSINPGNFICVHSDGTIERIVAIYATLKAGATYCPLDERLSESVRDANFKSAGATLFLRDKSTAQSLNPPSAALCLSVKGLVASKGSTPVKEIRRRMIHLDSSA